MLPGYTLHKINAVKKSKDAFDMYGKDKARYAFTEDGVYLDDRGQNWSEDTIASFGLEHCSDWMTDVRPLRLSEDLGTMVCGILSRNRLNKPFLRTWFRVPPGFKTMLDTWNGATPELLESVKKLLNERALIQKTIGHPLTIAGVVDCLNGTQGDADTKLRAILKYYAHARFRDRIYNALKLDADARMKLPADVLATALTLPAGQNTIDQRFVQADAKHLQHECGAYVRMTKEERGAYSSGKSIAVRCPSCFIEARVQKARDTVQSSIHAPGTSRDVEADDHDRFCAPV